MFARILLPALLVLGLSLPAQAQSGEPSRSEARFSLSATGEVRIVPDQATVSAGVVTRADSAAGALQANARAMQAAFAELRRAGVAERDMQTSRLSVQPVYSRPDPRGNEEARITGYEARNSVTALVRDLDRVGPAVDAMFRAGANTLEGLDFSSSQADEARDEARRRAVADLYARRDLYAEAAGFEIVRLTQFSESGGIRFQPAMLARAEMASDVSTPVAAGELSVTVTVEAAWEIEG